MIQIESSPSDERLLKRTAYALKNLGKKETDIVCLPEQWLNHNMIDNPQTKFKQFVEIAKEYSMTIIAGAFYLKDKEKQVIASPIITEDGKITTQQHKIHPFEYERNLVEPGKQAVVFNSSRCKFGVIICHDMVFPEVARTMAKKGAEAIFSPSRIVKHGIIPWHTYVAARSLENRIPIVTANVHSNKYGGKSIVSELREKKKIMVSKTTIVRNGQKSNSVTIDLAKYNKARKIRLDYLREFH